MRVSTRKMKKKDKKKAILWLEVSQNGDFEDRIIIFGLETLSEIQHLSRFLASDLFS